MADPYAAETNPAVFSQIGRVPPGEDPAAKPEHGRGWPLSFSQEMLALFDAMWPGTASETRFMVMKYSGRLSGALLQLALNTIVQRHEVLRTTYEGPVGDQIQVVRLPSPVPLRIVEFAGCDSLADQELRNWIELERRRPLEAEIPAVASAIAICTSFTVVTLRVSNFACDFWSVNLIFEELRQNYVSLARGEKWDVERASFQMADVAVWQREWERSQAFRDGIDYWVDKLGDLGPQRIFGDRSHYVPPPNSDGYGSVARGIPENTWLKFQALCKRKRMTLFAGLLSTYMITLARFSGISDTTVAIWTTGREDTKLESVIGNFLNIVAIRVKLDPELSVDDAISRVSKALIEGYRYGSIPIIKQQENLPRVAEMLADPQNTSTIFQLATDGSFESIATSSSAFEDTFKEHLDKFEYVSQTEFLLVDDDESDEIVFGASLDLVIRPRRKGAVCVASYERRAVDRHSVDRLVEDFVAVLDAIVLNQVGRIGQL